MREPWKLPARLSLTREENQRFLSALADYPEAVKITLSLYDDRGVLEQISDKYEDDPDTRAIYPDELDWHADWHIDYYYTNLHRESVGQEWGLIDPSDIGAYWFTWPRIKTHTPNFDKDKTP